MLVVISVRVRCAHFDTQSSHSTRANAVMAMTAAQKAKAEETKKIIRKATDAPIWRYLLRVRLHAIAKKCMKKARWRMNKRARALAGFRELVQQNCTCGSSSSSG